ncbi:MAG: hypothetical protein HQ564_04450 [Candidatus Saganbacteria bacterium]|nr:hypothetical protein [Candidatus Saganbacteria bacterium]
MNVNAAARLAIKNNRIATVILDSGKATRQGPLCNYVLNPNAVTKGGLPAGNLCLTDFQVEAARNLGLPKLHLTVPQHQGRSRLKKYYQDKALHGIKVDVYEEDRIRGTLGVINKLFADSQINPDSIDTLCVLFGDTVHNIDLLPILEAHLESRASLTAAVHRIYWEAHEWEARSFGTFVLDGMPRRSDFSNPGIFEKKQEEFVLKNQNACLPVTGFCEQVAEPVLDRVTSDSNLLFCGIAFLDMKFWRDLSQNISPDYYDIGRHLFPALGGRLGEFSGDLSPDFVRKIEQNQYPAFAYLVPDSNPQGKKVYCRDITNPLALLRANQEIANGLIDTRLEEPGCRFWRRLSPNGFVGTSGSNLYDITISRPQTPEGIGPIIGSHCTLERTTVDSSTIIGDHTDLLGGNISGSLIFGGSDQKKKSYIREWRIQNSIVFGPVTMNSNDEQWSLGDSPLIKDAIVFATPAGPEAWTRVSIRKKWGL